MWQNYMMRQKVVLEDIKNNYSLYFDHFGNVFNKLFACETYRPVYSDFEISSSLTVFLYFVFLVFLCILTWSGT